MGELCTSPFDGDSFYDIDVEHEIDTQIINASIALSKVDPPELSY